MKTKFTLAVMAAAVLLTGCWQKSVHPFYKENDIFFEEKLLGVWRDGGQSSDDATTWTFEKGDVANVYKVRIVDKEHKIECDGRLFKVGESRMLDLYSRNRGVIDMPAHTLMRVAGIGEAVKLQLMSPTWLKNRLQLHPKEIPNIFAADPEHPGDSDKGEFILTADTEALQKFVKQHMTDEGFWEDINELVKGK